MCILVLLCLNLFFVFIDDTNINAADYSWGSTGETVRDIQKKLKRWGYFNGNIVCSLYK